ncbi:uncharacterized protein BCR38DRAFT_458453 [Pseudomassariella vexata]|uniref:Beta-glucuronidase C-terminal domain-containing protein n=1 Tax=Pseudomassariella vexata TaxID=1141098 RepID=A0A1Y2DVX1_9PEZI|nr:uncharacterized protein BCR38DRAFT_458453 [Pseudomassariella vexata]ORY63264.1 hypothetical protein BCR38DRAFT_458453 [Pseudomassariella vexata]
MLGPASPHPQCRPRPVSGSRRRMTRNRVYKSISLRVLPDVQISIPTNLSTRPFVSDVYGYSIEPIWVDAYLSTPLAANLLNIIANVTGKHPPLRIGGNSADATYQHAILSTGNDSVALPSLPDAVQLNITPTWYRTWSDYFPQGSDLIFTLNFAVNDSAWVNGLAQAEAAHEALGSKLKAFELGNEIDHWINKGWRDETWRVDTYLSQWRNLTGQIVNSPWYKNATNPPTIQSGVFADPPWVPDQQDEMDDFDIVNLTAQEFQSDRDLISSYAIHLYPQSTCDTERWYRMSLDLLSNHTTLWLNVSQYIPQVAAAEAAGTPLVMGETNSVSCGGRSGISDTFGAALWGVDYVLMAASLGIQKVYFHLGAQSEYSSFTPQGYEYKNDTLTAGIRPGWYGHYFVAKAMAAPENETLSLAALPGANSSELSGYAVYSGAQVQKLVFLDMGVWNGTKGLSNPSTLNATDGTVFSEGERPNTTLRVMTPWEKGSSVTITRLSAPGTNAKSNVTVAGLSFDGETGDKVGEETVEAVTVENGGLVDLRIVRAEACLKNPFLSTGTCLLVARTP